MRGESHDAKKRSAAAGFQRSAITPYGIPRNQTQTAAVVLTKATGTEARKKATGDNGPDYPPANRPQPASPPCSRPRRCAWRNSTTSSPLMIATTTAYRETESGFSK